MLPEPRKDPLRLHPELRGISPDDRTYRFPEATTDACDRLFNGEGLKMPEESLRVREAQRHRLSFLLQEREPDNSSVLIEIGAAVKCRIGDSSKYEYVVPFLVATRSSCPSSPVRLNGGIYFPERDSFERQRLDMGDAAENDPQFLPRNYLAVGLQWVRLMERVHDCSTDVRTSARNFLLGGKHDPTIARSTGAEVLEEILSAPIEGFEAAYDRCRSYGVELSEWDLYRGMRRGAVPFTADTKPIFEYFEYSRNETRSLTAPLREVYDALRARKCFGLLPRYSLKQLERRYPVLNDYVNMLEWGIGAARLVEIGEGSPLATIEGAMTKCRDAFQEVKNEVSLRNLTHEMWKRIEPLDALFQEFFSHLRSLESEYPNARVSRVRLTVPDASNWGRALPIRKQVVGALMDICVLESGALHIARELSSMERVANAEVDGEYGSRDLSYCYVLASEALVSIRRELDCCFPGFFEFRQR